MRHFIDTQDFDRVELEHLLELVRLLKDADRDAAVPQQLPRRSLGMIFEQPATRTRVSFEVAMTKLGGHGLYLKPVAAEHGWRDRAAAEADPALAAHLRAGDRGFLHPRDRRHPARAVAVEAAPDRRPRRNVQGDLRAHRRRKPAESKRASAAALPPGAAPLAGGGAP